MANIAEATFYSHLTDVESLDYIVREGFVLEAALEVLPTEVGRRLTLWAIDYYFDNGRKVAPSKDAIIQTWGSQLKALNIEIVDDVEIDSIQWSIDQLRTDYADHLTEQFTISMAKAVRLADGPDRAGVVLEYSQILHGLSQGLISRQNEMDGYEGIQAAIERYEERAANKTKFEGMTLGLPEIDEHIRGVHPGELMVLAATSGGGKSWMSILVLLEEFSRDRKTILFTLENDLEMTFDRIACVKCHVDYEDWQKGDCNEADVSRVKDFLKIMEESEYRPIIIQPDTTEATGAAMVRRAFIEGADSIIIDQLSHIEPVAGTQARQRNEVVAEIIKDLYKLINNSGQKIPCLLLHQINRKGREEARKAGRFLMDHLGEATQVENAADFVLAIYQSIDHAIAEQAELQMLKGRRVKVKDWEIVWRPAVGDVRVRKEVTHD